MNAVLAHPRGELRLVEESVPIPVVVVAAAMRSPVLYDLVDLDGDASMDVDELARWLFSVVDSGRDGRLDPSEWETAAERGWVG